MAHTNTMADTTFLQIFSEFNENLKNVNRKTGRAGTPYIGVISHASKNITSAVSAKDTPEMFIEAFEEAIKQDGDYEDVKIVKAETFDYGYQLEISVSYVDAGEECKDIYYINHTTVY